MRTTKATLCILLILLIVPFLRAGENNRVTLVKAFPNLSFDSPVFFCHSNDGTNRVFVEEQRGVIRVFANDSTASNTEVFLDIDGRVTSGGEMGLLGLAFHPNYSGNGYFYVNYTTTQNGPRRTVISRFSAQGNQADPNSELIILEVAQPFSNHNAGMIDFGGDGYLYISLGDGGSGGDPQNNGQNRTTLLGSLLRIDVDNPAAGLNYGIPADNPFVGEGGGVREEIFAYGLRNAWRFSIDKESGEIWAGDVGQSAKEEIDLIEKGGNYGWRIMEGFNCFNPSSGCDQNGLTLPIVDHDRSVARSITGGYIYRGTARPEFTGAYIYGDFETGIIWLLRYENSQVAADSLLLDTALNISSFGIDAQNELYLLDYFAGEIYKFEATPPTGINDPNQPDFFQLAQNYPNPFNPTTTISYRLEKTARVDLTIYNTAGQKVTTLLDANQHAGEYQVKWRGENDSGDRVASGVYFYKFRAGDLTQTRKMILLR